MDEQFKGYCFPLKDDPWHTPAIDLNGVKEAVGYVNLQKRLFYEVRVVDEDDMTIIQSIAGKIVFPVAEVPA